MSPAEQKFFHDYLQLVDKYSNDLSESVYGKASRAEFDLMVDQTPPKDLFVEVRVLQELGAVFLPESGSVNLQKDTTHLLRKSECENLIKRGVVALVQKN